MKHPLLGTQKIEQMPEPYLAEHGRIFASFGENTQDSGNISYSVQIGEERFFVKTAGFPNDPKPLLKHPERVALLETAVTISNICSHTALVNLHHVVQSPHGPMLIYEWVAGELIRSVMPRFRALAVPEILAVLDVIYDLHVDLAEAGWVALDFYDGCLIYDFDTKVVRVMDLDFYHKRPFINKMGRLFGSSRYMSPEEFELGATIDQRSTVFTMGRTAVNLLS
ncbi:MAG: hypothetical protein AAF490_29695, partial [Chloroflexota bacterium]